MRIITPPPSQRSLNPPKKALVDRPSKRLTGFLLSVLLLVIIWQSPASFRWRIFFRPFRHLQKQETLLERDQNSLQRGGGLGVLESIKAAGLQKRTLAGWTTSPESGVPSSSSPPPLSGEQQPLAPRKQLDVAFTPTKSAKNMSRFGRFPKHPKACSCWALLRFVTCYANFPPGEGEG